MRLVKSAILAALIASGGTVAPLAAYADASDTAVTSLPVTVTHSFFFKVFYHRYVACVDFRNSAATTANAIRFEIAFVNSFGDATVAHGDRLGTFSPGVMIEGPASIAEFNSGARGTSFNSGPYKIRNCWVTTLSDTPISITVEISRVAYVDGTVWTNPTIPAGTPASMAADAAVPR